MESLKVFILLLAAMTAVLGQRITIDTVEDLATNPGWTVTCDRGYQRSVSDFVCHNRLRPSIPSEDLNGEVGFWTGCFSNCILTYTLQPSDAGVGFRAYLNGVQHMVLLLNDLVYEHVAGTKWIDVNLDTTFIRTVGFYMPEITSSSFVMLDKVYIDPVVPTTTEAPSTTTEPTTEPPTTTIEPTTEPPTTTIEPTTEPPTTTTELTTEPPTTTTEPTTEAPTTTTEPTTEAPSTTTEPTTEAPTTSTTTTEPPANFSTTTESPTTTEDPANWVCPEGFVGPIAHPFDCRMFFICDPGRRPCLFECPIPLYYNPEIKDCDWPDNVPSCEGGTPPPPTSKPPVYNYRTIQRTHLLNDLKRKLKSQEDPCEI